MNSSIDVLQRTLSTTNAHVELDHLTTITEQWGDVSIDVSAYYDYDIAKIPVDTSITEEDKIAMRHTHLHLDSLNSSTYYKDLFQFYIDNNLYPVPFFFKGSRAASNEESSSETEFNEYEQSYEEQQFNVNMITDLRNSSTAEPTIGNGYVITRTSASAVTIDVDDNIELTNITIPDVSSTITLNANIKSGTTIINKNNKTIEINNTSAKPTDIIVNTTGTAKMSGKYNNIEFAGTTISNTGTTAEPQYPQIYGNLVISDDVDKAVTINAEFKNPDGNVISSNTSQNITINTKNDDANVIINCPNATVILNGTAQYNNIEANVSDNTLKFNSLGIHINKLNLKHGNIFINNGKNVLNDLVDEVICKYEYKVDWNKATILPNSPSACEYTLEADRTGAVTWGTFASGDTVINLNNHNIHNEGTDGRPTLNVRNDAHVDINGEGNVSNTKEYCVWGNGVNTVITINGGHFSGATHVVYSYNGLIEINGGEFELVGEYDKDAKGHAKFLLNCFDPSFTAGTAKIIVKGGKYHNFNPAEAYGEPTQPFNYVAEGYESVCIDEANQIYEVRKI